MWIVCVVGCSLFVKRRSTLGPLAHFPQLLSTLWVHNIVGTQHATISIFVNFKHHCVATQHAKLTWKLLHTCTKQIPCEHGSCSFNNETPAASRSTPYKHQQRKHAPRVLPHDSSPPYQPLRCLIEAWRHFHRFGRSCYGDDGVWDIHAGHAQAR